MARIKKGLTNFDLKIIGIVLMLVDHIHEELGPLGIPTWFDMLGRVVAPIFIFLSVEGFTHTHNKFKYMQRLLIGFWIMSFGSFIIQKSFPVDGGRFALVNNIFATLLLGIVSMYAIEHISQGYQRKDSRQLWRGISILLAEILVSSAVLILMTIGSESIQLFSAITTMVIPNIFITEGGILYVILAVMLYLFRNHRNFQIASLALIAFLSTDFNFTNLLTSNYNWMLVFAAIPIWFYNGQKGHSSKYFFYIFYPAHIWLLYLIAYSLNLKGF
ncbi:TraX family protein [Agrilactobacillus fermenti]|uniref:TraX family protein n=1 Tax=Agrilactobacillus fermenti TaxID=2586909 RepID=UPI003A5C441B